MQEISEARYLALALGDLVILGRTRVLGLVLALALVPRSVPMPGQTPVAVVEKMVAEILCMGADVGKMEYKGEKQTAANDC